MAVVQRFFDSAGAGAADGTTWADRAPLLVTGVFNSIIRGFDFSGSDSLECLIAAGTYTVTTVLTSASFTTAAPTVANPLTFHGCDSSGVKLEPPDPDWTSDQPAWDDSTMPVIATTTDIQTLSFSGSEYATFYARLIKFTATASNNSAGFSAGSCDWCIFENSRASTTTSCGAWRATNSVFKQTGSSYSRVVAVPGNQVSDNLRLEGVAGSSGNRHGMALSGNGSVSITRLTIIGVGGDGINSGAAGTAHRLCISKATIVGCGGDGIALATTASQIDRSVLDHLLIVNCGAYGLHGESGRVRLFNCRFRDNTSGNITSIGNWPTDMNIFTTDSDDATEFVDSGAGDYRVANDSIIAGMGFGVSEEPPASVGGGTAGVIGS